MYTIIHYIVVDQNAVLTSKFHRKMWDNVFVSREQTKFKPCKKEKHMKNSSKASCNLYSIDFTSSKIMINKEFMRRASVYNSKEYNLMMSFKRELPEFEIELLNKQKDNSSLHLSFDVMEAYLQPFCLSKHFVNTSVFYVREQPFDIIGTLQHCTQFGQ